MRYPQPVEDLLDQFHLPPELLRRRAPGGLVLRVGLIAEGLPAHVEGDGTWLGSSAVSKPMSMETKPCTAFVCCPVEVWKFSAGRAKKAR